MLKWTKVPPTRYGLYWIKYEDNATDIVEVRKSHVRDVFVVGTMGYTLWQPMKEFVEEYHQPLWYGPLEAPEGG